MKKTYPEYYNHSDSELKSLWNNCIFVLDTNVLIGFYELSLSARKDWLDFLNDNRNRLWMPHRVGFEFSRKRESVIEREIKKGDIVAKIKAAEGEVTQLIQNRFHFSETKKENLQDLFQAIVKFIKDYSALDF